MMRQKNLNPKTNNLKFQDDSIQRNNRFQYLLIYQENCIMSYMDRKNILSEGFFDKLMKAFKLDRKVMKDPEVKKQFKKLDKGIKDLEKSVNAKLKKRGIKPIKV